MSQMGVFVIPEAPSPDAAVETPQAARRGGPVRIAILDNSKSNADHLLEMLMERLQREVPVASVLKLRKPTAGLPMPKEVMDQLIREADCVVTAMAD